MKNSADLTIRNARASKLRDEKLLTRIKAIETKLRDELKAIKAALKKHGASVK